MGGVAGHSKCDVIEKLQNNNFRIKTGYSGLLEATKRRRLVWLGHIQRHKDAPIGTTERHSTGEQQKQQTTGNIYKTITNRHITAGTNRMRSTA